MKKRLFLFLCLSGVAPANSATPIPGAPFEQQATVRFVYAGFTQRETTGFVRSNELTGIPVMNAMCQDEFGEAARAATTSDLEFVEGPIPDVGDKEGIWVVPSYPLQVLSTGLETYEVFDSAGEYAGQGSDAPSLALRRAGCSRFRSARGTGPAMKPSENFSVFEVTHGACDIARPIACSLPRKISLPQ